MFVTFAQKLFRVPDSRFQVSVFINKLVHELRKIPSPAQETFSELSKEGTIIAPGTQKYRPVRKQDGKAVLP